MQAAVSELTILDHALKYPHAYREAALRREFKTFDFGHCVFHGIALCGIVNELTKCLYEFKPQLAPTLSFFRKSPLGQVEPHFIHSDVDMGDWTAILYLNPLPPDEDGTDFWTHRESGAIESAIAHERSAEGRDRTKWELREHVSGRFNRLLLFPSPYFHSRAIFENWGSESAGRLIQEVFGKGSL